MILSSIEIKLNTKLRRLIKEFMEDDKKDEPEEIMDYLLEYKDEIRVLVPVDVAEGDLEKVEKLADEGAEVVDMNIKLIEDEDHDSWIPVFTSEETFDADDEKDDSEKMPISLFDIMGQIVDDEGLSGIVIDPWTISFPLPDEVIRDLLDEGGVQGGISLIKGNIEELDVDAVVNSANNTLAPGEGGVNACVFKAAGDGLADELRTMRGCKTGEAKISDSYKLPCKYIIHTVGPIYSGKAKDEDDLGDCYENSLYLAREHGLHSIAFPCIATGNFGYPKDEAMETAVQTVLEWLQDNDDYAMTISFCCHNDKDFEMYQNYLNEELGDPE